MIVLASFTNGGRRHRRAHASHASSSKDRFVVGDPVDLAQLLGDQVGAVQRLVGLLDLGKRDALALGEFALVLPQREAGGLELLRFLLMAGAARLVPHLPADLVERVGRELDHVEWVHAPDGVRAPVADRQGDRFGHVAGHQLDLLATIFAEQVQELLDRLAIPAGGGPDEPAGVVVDYDRQVHMTFPIGEVVDGVRLVRVSPTLVVTRWS